MKKKIKYAKGDIGDLKVVRDFLPVPEQLAFKEENVKVTIALSRHSIEFFKKHAQRNHMQYQRMIRRLLDYYASQYEGMPSTGR